MSPYRFVTLRPKMVASFVGRASGSIRIEQGGR
jgi:hypothetical protein